MKRHKVVKIPFKEKETNSKVMKAYSSQTNVAVVQSLSCVQLFVTPGFLVLYYLQEFAQTHVH